MKTNDQPNCMTNFASIFTGDLRIYRIYDQDCASFLACRNTKCVDPCNCPSSAQCNVVNHRPTCRCPPGLTGDPYTSCTPEPFDTPECTADADCPSKLACFSGSCKDPCRESQPCITNAKCLVIDTLPMRTMICECLPNYIGDATVACAPVQNQIQPTCKSDSDCPTNEACLNRVCANPCTINPCASSAECRVENHRHVCSCSAGLTGDGFVGCYRDPTPAPECTSNSDCPSNLGCVNQRCVNPCANSRCGSSADCITIDHHPSCHCPEGFAGNPQIQCFRPECKIDDDCPYDKSCRNGNCASPCLDGDIVCGRGAECTAVAHRGQCTCPRGTQGNPFVACISAVCHYNEDCADHEACDRLARVCRPVCDDQTCPETANCVARNHQPKCVCRPGLVGNPDIECTVTSEEAECREDGECPSLLACINARCQNPCALSSMCSIEQECRVLNTVPMRTMICQCPVDTVTDENGNCRKIVWQDVECRADEECQQHEKCLNGRCVEACTTMRCGINAQCKSSSHTGICTCPADFTGNPYTECVQSRNNIPPPQPECYSSNECPNDKQCINLRCDNPCVIGEPCGRDSLCHVDNHSPVCRCPINYTGDPRIECRSPVLVLGCLSNSECAGTEACINGHCTNPCNCGPNANCVVANHYPSCVCLPGYSGNPQLGCVKLDCESDVECPYTDACHEGRCINPCLLSNECAINAECYGKNHRSACRCGPGYFGNPEVLCERVECTSDWECPRNLACDNRRCVDPCAEKSPCAQNAKCYVRNHVPLCRCPDDLPAGDPFSYCERRPPIADEPECRKDVDCPSKLACIDETCVNPCQIIRPCLADARCGVLDTTPVRTMVCTCPEGWITDSDGICRQIRLDVVGACKSDDECTPTETCVNRRCRDPCNCGRNANCLVRNHKPICSCDEGYQGNPEVSCQSVECRSDAECSQDRSCVNQSCVNPCVLSPTRCGTNAECVAIQHAAECRCREGFIGDPQERCNVIGCYSNGDCPGDRACVNKQCVDPCLRDNPCSARAECRVRGHLASCRCPPGYVGNPHVDCRPDVEPECRVDGDCPGTLACFNAKCQNPCRVVEPCQTPSECKALPTLPVRTMVCVCPNGFVSSGSGTCLPIKPFVQLECKSDSDCSPTKACVNSLCRDPCDCGSNALCTVNDHKPICSCVSGYDGNPDIECGRVVGCRSDSECSDTDTCLQNTCVPACSPLLAPCAKDAVCYGINHQAVCECPPGYAGNPRLSCTTVGCKSNTDCPTNRACVNSLCENPCEAKPCGGTLECSTYNHVVECSCPPGFVGDIATGCEPVSECKHDYECPSQTACFNGECINPCTKIEPCGVNADCKVLDSKPVRTMVCECLPGYRGNAVVRCDKIHVCAVEKGQVRDEYGNCICPPGTAKDDSDVCVPCRPEAGMIITPDGRCDCALERGMIIDKYGRCVCPLEAGYRLDRYGNCKPTVVDCIRDDDCADDRYCEQTTKTCEDPCLQENCAFNADCTVTGHRAFCQPATTKPPGYARTDFPKPAPGASCLSDGVQVQVELPTPVGFDGVLYVKGHSKEEKCRLVLSVPAETVYKPLTFKVAFGDCGLIHVNGQASFVLVIQKHPQLVTIEAQAYHVKCIYQTGEQNVTLGFNVSMLTTAGTIANTGPPPICEMRIVTQSGSKINTAEIGENLMLEVAVRPNSIYGGFARNCVAKTTDNDKENEYVVTDENGCATDPTIFGEWKQHPDGEALVASFNAFKFPSSDNIRFQCNIRVCFGRCQPVNCRGYNAFGRRRREVGDEFNDTAISVSEGFDGQLREEITITSNLIRTKERMEERYSSDPTQVPSAQRVEEICVSMFSFIVALVITALVALVAVAIAVSCWIMAYRRQPNTAGPLPHPPEFPNPLFTTESVAEPSPDYHMS